MSPRTRQAAAADGDARGMLEGMDDAAEQNQSRRWGFSGRRRAVQRQQKALAMSTRRDLRLGSVSGSDVMDLEEVDEDDERVICESSDTLDDAKHRSRSLRRSVRQNSRGKARGLLSSSRLSGRRGAVYKPKTVGRNESKIGSSSHKTGLSSKQSLNEDQILRFLEKEDSRLRDSASEGSDNSGGGQVLFEPFEQLQSAFDVGLGDSDEEVDNDFDLEKQEELDIIQDVIESGELDFVGVDDFLAPPEGYELRDIRGYNFEDLINLGALEYQETDNLNFAMDTSDIVRIYEQSNGHDTTNTAAHVNLALSGPLPAAVDLMTSPEVPSDWELGNALAKRPSMNPMSSLTAENLSLLTVNGNFSSNLHSFEPVELDRQSNGTEATRVSKPSHASWLPGVDLQRIDMSNAKPLSRPKPGKFKHDAKLHGKAITSKNEIISRRSYDGIKGNLKGILEMPAGHKQQLYAETDQQDAAQILALPATARFSTHLSWQTRPHRASSPWSRIRNLTPLRDLRVTLEQELFEPVTGVATAESNGNASRIDGSAASGNPPSPLFDMP